MLRNIVYKVKYMKSLSSVFNKNYTKKYQSYGFCRKKSTYARIKGDTIQAFTLRYFYITRSYSVEFGIWPLCLPQPVFLDGGIYNLYQFVDDPYNNAKGWVYEKDSEESIEQCAESISRVIDEYLLPFFDTCHDCQTALPQLIKLEKQFEIIRLNRLKAKGIKNCAKPWQWGSLWDGKKYYMALKSDNWPYVKRYLDCQIEHHKKTIASFDDPNATKQPEIVKQRFSEGLIELVERMDHLQGKDYGYFKTSLQTNETKMCEYLADQYPKLLLNP